MKNYPGKLHEVNGARKSKFIMSIEDVKMAYELCSSIGDAAKQLNMSDERFKHYAQSFVDEQTGKTYYQLFIDRPRIEAPNRYKNSMVGKEKIEKILKGEQTNTVKNVDQFKYALLRYGFFRDQCNECGYFGKRSRDMKSPILVSFKDGDHKNGKQTNIEMLCYCCAFTLCDSNAEFNRMIKDSELELDATSILSNSKVVDNQSDIDVSDEDDQEILDFLSKNGLDLSEI